MNIDLALNVLYQRQITSREQLLKEMLRVKLTASELQNNPKIVKDKEKLFQFMKETTEDELGFFPADRNDFTDIFAALKDIDLIDFALEIYKNDRTGTIISPVYLTDYIKTYINRINPEKILISEAEKHLSGLKQLIVEYPNAEFTLTTQFKQMNLLLKLGFSEFQNVKVIFESIYSDCLLDMKFDYIYSLPAFGNKIDEMGKEFITRESDGVALENMLEHLAENGSLDIIVPAKITFAGMGFEKLRNYITDNFNVKSIFILPEGTFRPVTAVKTYLLTISREAHFQVELGTLKLNKDTFDVAERKLISTEDFLSHEDWRIELLLADDDQNIKKFKSSSLEKVKLKQVAEVFRGKSILKKDTTLGSISVLNISDIENGEIDYSDMDTIEEVARKIKRYELMDGDVILSCRGTAIKSAVFKQQDKIIIASANVIVIRPQEKVLGYYIKIFFESPVGTALIKSFQRGTTIMNINHHDIMEMEIPLIPISEQQEMVKQYNDEFSIYKAAVSEAVSRWDDTRNRIYSKLT